MIEGLKVDIASNLEIMEKKNGESDMLNKTLEELENMKEQLKESIDKEQQKYISLKNEPDRLAKKNQNFQNEVDVIKTQLETLNEEMISDNRRISKKEEEKHKLEEEKKMLDKASQEKKKTTVDLDNQKHQKDIDKISLEKQKSSIESNRAELENNNSQLIKDRKLKQKEKSKLSKEIEEKKRMYKKYELQNANFINQKKELETQVGSTMKFIEEKRREVKIQGQRKKNIQEENQLFVGQLVKKGLEEKNMEQHLENHKTNITHREELVEQMQKTENTLIENIKFLSNLREKMARTASSAMSQARETKEELKVKELLILDLTKKQQETEFRLNSFIALYEEVKNARNRYVSMIQNSSQDLAEMKERIKILQNEVEILRNESSEKDRALVDVKHQVQREIYLRDTKRAELNKLEFKFKEKMAISNQKGNEGDKLNLIISSLEKDMNDLTEKYEKACEDRNHMGIQLIDRNDELCILYEKSNIHENILKNGEQEIREKEEEIRMLNLELKERQRQQEVIRKRIPHVPSYAVSIKQMKH